MILNHSCSVLVSAGNGIDPEMTLENLFRDGRVEITVFQTSQEHVKTNVAALTQISIWRKELRKRLI